MRVVVTGGTGNVGTGVVAALARDERVDEVVAVARREPDALPEGVRFRPVDVTTDALEPIFDGADAVIHLAWLFQPTHRPTVTWDANVGGSKRVFTAAGMTGVRVLVHASSVGVYSSPPEDRGRPVDETWPSHSLPTAGYGREKAYVERLLDSTERDHPGMRVVRLRPGFIFRRASASEQRRLFLGPFVPGSLLRPGRLPVLPWPKGLRFQVLHTDDVADAYVRAVTTDVAGPFNVAADEVLGSEAVGQVLGARPVELPAGLVRGALAAGWAAHLVPADPKLFDLVMALPVMDTSRARRELGWTPRHTAREALAEVAEGMAAGAGAPTPPLAPDSLEGRVHEVATGMGEKP